MRSFLRGKPSPATAATGVTSQNGLFSRLPNHGKPWWKVPHLLKLNVYLLVPLVGSYVTGYDGSIINGVQSVQSWQETFNHPTGGTLGLLATIQVIGGLFILPIAPFVCDKYGRRLPIALGSIILCIGVAVQTSTTNLATFIIGRGLLGVGNGFVGTACGPLVAELAYPTHRSVLTAIFNTSWYLGSITAAWTTYGTFKIPNNWSWRIPFLLQAIPSIAQLVFIYLIPESPRYLISQGRSEEAIKVLSRCHAGSEEPTDYVLFEANEIATAIRNEAAQQSNGYTHFFKTPGNRHRLFICISLGFIVQWAGNGLVSYYLIVVLNSIGITNPKTQNTINGMLQIYNYFVAIGAAFTVDRIGRRTLLLVGTLGMVLSFIVWTAISAANEQRNFENAGLGIGVVVMIFVFFFFYNIGLNPVPIAYLLEILPFTLRTKGLAIFSLAQFGSSIFNGFVNPIAIKEIGWKYYFVFICLLVTWLLVFWFGYPETRGVSLEEVSAIFDGDEARDGMVNELQTKANGSSHHVEQVAADMV